MDTCGSLWILVDPQCRNGGRALAPRRVPPLHLSRRQCVRVYATRAPGHHQRGRAAPGAAREVAAQALPRRGARIPQIDDLPMWGGGGEQASREGAPPQPGYPREIEGVAEKRREGSVIEQRGALRPQVGRDAVHGNVADPRGPDAVPRARPSLLELAMRKADQGHARTPPGERTRGR